MISKNTKVITGKVRMCYVNLFTARARVTGTEPRYSLCILIPKSDVKTVNDIKAAIEAAKKMGETLWGEGEPFELKLPLRDGDEERKGQTEYEGHYFLNSASKYRPGIIDKDRNGITGREELYSGCYGRVSIYFYAFNQGENKGIGCGLLNVQKLAEGEPLSVRISAEEDFDTEFNEDNILW